MKEERKNPASQQHETAVDKAGVGQTDQEKGIASKEEQEQKRKELLKNGKATKAAHFNHTEEEGDEERPAPLHMKGDD